jgi:hypothetical protein
VNDRPRFPSQPFHWVLVLEFWLGCYGLEKVALQGMSYSDRRKRSNPARNRVVSHPNYANWVIAKESIAWVFVVVIKVGKLVCC